MPTPSTHPSQANMMPLIMTVTNEWAEGVSKEDVIACLKAVQEKAMTVDGVFAFQYSINEEKKENVVTEIYKDASVIGTFFAAIGDPAEAFKAIKTTKTICCGPKAQVEAAAGALKDFSPTLYYMDDVGGAVNPPTEDTGAATPLIMSVTNEWAEGASKEDVVAGLKAVQEKAMGVDGIYAFQYAINEEKKENHVTEVYKDASVIGTFFAAIGDPAEAFKTIKTTNTIACGNKEAIEAAGGALKDFSPTLYLNDELGSAAKGFGGK
eukprot:g1860.t1